MERVHLRIAPVAALNFGDWGKGETFWSPLRTLRDPVGTLQASKQAKGDKEMDLSCRLWREVAISFRSGRHRVVPELDFRLKVQ